MEQVGSKQVLLSQEPLASSITNNPISVRIDQEELFFFFKSFGPLKAEATTSSGPTFLLLTEPDVNSPMVSYQPSTRSSSGNISGSPKLPRMNRSGGSATSDPWRETHCGI